MGELDGKFFDGVKRLDHTTVEWICGITGRLEIEALDPEGAVPALQMQMSKPHGCWAEGHESSTSQCCSRGHLAGGSLAWELRRWGQAMVIVVVVVIVAVDRPLLVGCLRHATRPGTGVVIISTHPFKSSHSRRLGALDGKPRFHWCSASVVEDPRQDLANLHSVSGVGINPVAHEICLLLPLSYRLQPTLNTRNISPPSP